MKFIMSNKLLFFVFSAVFSTIFISCKNVEPPISATDKSYFDLTKIIQTDINHNIENNCSEEKTVYIKGNKETKVNDSIDWQSELKPLLECDINRVAWKGNFFIDTIPSDLTSDITVQYRALDEKISVRSLSIVYDNSKIKKITINKKIESFLFSTVQIIDYVPSFGFLIRGEQKALMMNTFELNVNVKYICKN